MVLPSESDSHLIPMISATFGIGAAFILIRDFSYVISKLNKLIEIIVWMLLGPITILVELVEMSCSY